MAVKSLSESQVAAWRRDGFLYPFPLLDSAGRQQCLDGLARFERWLGGPVNGPSEFKWRTMPHLLLPWVMDLARDPRILDPVEDLIGPDILIFTSTFFIKEAGTPTVAAWHQDSTYFGLAPKDQVTVWIALSEASRAAGCMEALPFNGQPRQMRHAAHVIENSVNRAGQQITEPLDETTAQAMALTAGEFSMHHGLCPHRSGPNTADHRRIGLGINYVPANAKPIGSVRMAAMLVRGQDRFGNFEPVAAPNAEFDAAAIAQHELAVGRYRQSYVEQEALHVGENA